MSSQKVPRMYAFSSKATPPHIDEMNICDFFQFCLVSQTHAKVEPNDGEKCLMSETTRFYACKGVSFVGFVSATKRLGVTKPQLLLFVMENSSMNIFLCTSAHK
jgi:hypothetical protein